MTNNQLNVILAAARLGSISAAAKELGLSQPNASSYIKTAEEEAGFKIFERTRDGIAVTPTGSALLEQAQRIADANKAIQEIKEHSKIRQFRLGSVSFSPATDAYIKLCQSCSSSDINFSHLILSMGKGMESLQNRETDLFVALTFDEDDLLINRICTEKHLRKVFIASVPTAITLRRGHPLLQQVTEISLKDRGDILKPYTMVFSAQTDNEGEADHTYKTYNIPHTGIVRVSEREEKFRIASKSDIFMPGIRLNADTKNAYGLVDIPITDIRFNIFYYIRENEREREEIKKYLELIKGEVESYFIDSDIVN